ncbi:hypothetical protein [Streptomyces sp. PU-14G]|uniref:hypothetical protein n=1 Tax=Streptomyces sp. PU-14G TaxID=2800808 RepID=UPI0034E0561A
MTTPTPPPIPPSKPTPVPVPAPELEPESEPEPALGSAPEPASAPAPAPALRATEWDGTVWDDPSEDQLHDLLADMNLRFRFVVVERPGREPAGHHYMQVHLNDDFSYRVEYREGGPEHHFQAHVPAQPEILRPEPVAGVLQAWAFDRPGWREALDWAPWDGPN